MDLNKVIERARSLLTTPRTQWPLLAEEPADVVGLYREYFGVLAAIPAVCGFVKACLIGYEWSGFQVYRHGFGTGLAMGVVGYGVSLASVYLLAIIIDALAPQFGGQQNRIQALKLSGYSYTASWIAGFGLLLPSGLEWLVMLAGAVYSVWLFYLGSPSTLKVPADRAASFTAVMVLIAFVLGWVAALITGGMTVTTV